ncbi:cation diffusion facilitator family transporter [Atopobiaceae bacterium 24-176]
MATKDIDKTVPASAAAPGSFERSEKERNAVVVKTGTIGIVSNVGLAAAKAAIGFASNSLAIVLDAVNSLTDAVSSIVTIAGVKLAARPADKEHPMGYGRVEYLSALLVAAAVFATGIITLRDSILKIMHPTLSTYNWVAVAVIVLSIAVKIWLGLYTRAKGRETRSDALDASGVDALFDALVTGATLVGIAVTMLWHVTIDGEVSALISLVVAKSGWDMLKDIVSEILGQRIEPALAKGLRAEIESFPPVIGAHDLFLDTFGPNETIGSVHLEVPANMTAMEIDTLSRKISDQIYREHHIVLTCGVYGADPEDPAWKKFNESIRSFVMARPGVLSMHGLFVDHDTNHVTFDVVRDFSITDIAAFKTEIVDGLKKLHPDYDYTVHVDVDYAA